MDARRRWLRKKESWYVSRAEATANPSVTISKERGQTVEVHARVFWVAKRYIKGGKGWTENERERSSQCARGAKPKDDFLQSKQMRKARVRNGNGRWGEAVVDSRRQRSVRMGEKECEQSLGLVRFHSMWAMTTRATTKYNKQ
jgi:hypothetical protein